MNGYVALATGVGLGLAYFGLLWRSVRKLGNVVGSSANVGEAPCSLANMRLVRFALAGLVFLELAQHGAGPLLLSLLGFWLARSCFLWRGLCHE